MRLLDGARHRTTLTTISITLMLAATVAAAFVSFSVSRERGIKGLQEGAENRLRLFKSIVFAPTDKYGYLPKLVSNYEVIAEALDRPDDEQRIEAANVLLERLNREAGSTVLYVMSISGQTIASSNWKSPQSFVGQNYAFRPYFTDALSKGDGRFYAMGVTTRQPGYYISRAVRKGSAVTGVIVVKIDISELKLGWEDKDHEMLVNDERGVIFLSSRSEWKYRPMGVLSAPAMQRLQHTRQYEGVLKDALPISVSKTLGSGERLVQVVLNERWYGDQTTEYFVKSGKLAGSDWSVVILTSLERINAQARQSAIMGAGAVTLLVFFGMYLNQLRGRARERNESRRALEVAHATLERNHRELQVLNEELHLKSITDPLTGIYNRRFFMESTIKLMGTARRYHHPLSLVMIDVDHFKGINDVHGHAIGDQVLQKVVMLCKKELREADVLARFGGEEFILALPCTDAEAAGRVADRIRHKVSQHPIDLECGTIPVTISCGVSQFLASDSDIQATMKGADQALYDAKNGGRNQVVIQKRANQ